MLIVILTKIERKSTVFFILSEINKIHQGHKNSQIIFNYKLIKHFIFLV